MHLRASHRRRLEQLLSIAGSPAVALALPWVHHWRGLGATRLLDYLAQAAPQRVVDVLEPAAALQTDDAFADCRHAYLLEELLAVSNAVDRRRRGVYYTPLEIVRFIVQAVDEALVEELGCTAGLASRTVRVLDPAAGSGLFLAETIRAIQARLQTTWQSQGMEAAQIQVRWNQYVSDQLLSRLTGWEIMPAAVVAAHCLLAETLRETGYTFADSQPLQLEQRDALAPQDTTHCNVILGNPPYASLSTAGHGWIEGLIQSPDDGYMTVDGQPLGEKKHWLHDDYVKFLRLAQWHVQQCGAGIVGMITNHGYLENASFRGMRASLLHTFSGIQIVDLHGNAKIRERAPDGARDESVFGITSGTAIGVFVRPPTLPMQAKIRRADLWGSRAEKLQHLATSKPTYTAIFTPVGPQYRFAPQDNKTSRAYQSAWRLCDAMPLNTTAPVTARDHFLVAFKREALIERIIEFRDLSIPDDVIRQRYFQRTRSSRYATGDSRSWKLGAARRALAADENWQDCIRLCQYRPLDYRYVLWHYALIDWPRREVLRHLTEQDNVALIARRQSPAGLPANFFWATRSLTLDGVIRSDNRGSESLFPLWQYDKDGLPQANFAAGFIDSIASSSGLRYVDRYEPLADTNATEFTTLALAGYVYSLFWCPNYRVRHQHELAADFPRIPPPASAKAFLSMSQRGVQLLRAHTRPALSMDDAVAPDETWVAPGYPQWRADRVWINANRSVAEISQAAWDMCVGAHQVARKWLMDRRGRRLTAHDVASYRSLVETLEATARLTASEAADH